MSRYYGLLPHTSGAILLLFVLALSASEVLSMGSAPSQAPVAAPTCGGVSVDHTPHPYRKVILKTVGTQLFPLPNGGSVDLTSELNQMLQTSVASSSTLAPLDPNTPPNGSDCGRHIEIRSGVTSLEMNVLQLGLTLGYSPTGSNPVSMTSAQGSMDVSVGTIGMDFSLWDCEGAVCSAVAASHADQSTTHLSLTLTVDFSTIMTGAQLVDSTDLGKILRNILDAGVAQLAASDRVNDLPWYATVRDFDGTSGSVTFDAGTQSRLQSSQTFTVYAANDATGSCNVYKPIANLHSTTVTAVSSIAVIDQVLDARKPQSGDVVMIRKSSGAQLQ